MLVSLVRRRADDVIVIVQISWPEEDMGWGLEATGKEENGVQEGYFYVNSASNYFITRVKSSDTSEIEILN